jgi:hypothetical protein
VYNEAMLKSEVAVIIRFLFGILGLFAVVLAGCQPGILPQAENPALPIPSETLPPSPTTPPTLVPSPSPTGTDNPEPTSTATPEPTTTETATPTSEPTETYTPTPTDTPEPTLTPTPASPVGRITMQANCRYGPGTAYLYAHGMYEGDEVQINGRSIYNSWLWIKPANLERHCWAAPSVMEINGDLDLLPRIQHNLPKTTFYWPPQNVQTVREGNQVTVSWDRINMTVDKDRGYLLEVTVCQNGALVWMAVRTDNTWYTFTDEDYCTGKSSGRLYTAEKHGYTDPVLLQWP